MRLDFRPVGKKQDDNKKAVEEKTVNKRSEVESNQESNKENKTIRFDFKSEKKDTGINVNKIPSVSAFEADTKQEQNGVQGNKISDFYNDKKEASTDEGAGSFSDIETKPITIDASADKTVKNTIESYNLKNRPLNLNSLHNRENSVKTTNEDAYAPSVNYPETKAKIDELQTKIDALDKNIDLVDNDYVKNEYINLRQKYVDELDAINSNPNTKYYTAEYKASNLKPVDIEDSPLASLSSSVDEVKAYNKEVEDYQKAYEDSQIQKKYSDAYNYYNKYAYKSADENLAGTIKANYIVGRIGQDESLAWNDYIDNPTEENRAYAQAISNAKQSFLNGNLGAVNFGSDEKGLKGELLEGVRTIANYIPQRLDQFKYTAPGYLVGLMTGGLGSQLLGSIGSGGYSYKTMRGAAFKGLLDLGVDEEVAREAASDEALISGIIEMGDTFVDLLMFAPEAVLNNVGGGLIKSVTKNLNKTAASRAVVSLLKWGLNTIQEGLEEETQESVSIANEQRAKAGNVEGKGQLFKDAKDIFLNNYFYPKYFNGGKVEMSDDDKKYSSIVLKLMDGEEITEDEQKFLKSYTGSAQDSYERISEAGKGGRIIGGVMGGVDIASKSIVDRIDEKQRVDENLKRRKQTGPIVDVEATEVLRDPLQLTENTEAQETTEVLRDPLQLTENTEAQETTEVLRDPLQLTENTEAQETTTSENVKPEETSVKNAEAKTEEPKKQDSKLTDKEKADKVSELSGSVVDISGEISSKTKFNLEVWAKELEKTLNKDTVSAEDKLRYATQINKINEALGKSERIDVSKYQQEAERFNPDTYAATKYYGKDNKSFSNWRELAIKYLGGYNINDYENQENFDKLLQRIADKYNTSVPRDEDWLNLPDRLDYPDSLAEGEANEIKKKSYEDALNSALNEFKQVQRARQDKKENRLVFTKGAISQFISRAENEAKQKGYVPDSLTLKKEIADLLTGFYDSAIEEYKATKDIKNTVADLEYFIENGEHKPVETNIKDEIGESYEEPEKFNVDEFAKEYGIPNWRVLAKKYGITFSKEDIADEESFKELANKIEQFANSPTKKEMYGDDNSDDSKLKAEPPKSASTKKGASESNESNNAHGDSKTKAKTNERNNSSDNGNNSVNTKEATEDSSNNTINQKTAKEANSTTRANSESENEPDAKSTSKTSKNTSKSTSKTAAVASNESILEMLNKAHSEKYGDEVYDPDLIDYSKLPQKYFTVQDEDLFDALEGAWAALGLVSEGKNPYRELIEREDWGSDSDTDPYTDFLADYAVKGIDYYNSTKDTSKTTSDSKVPAKSSETVSSNKEELSGTQQEPSKVTNTEPVPDEKVTEKAKADIKKAVKIEVETNNKDALKYAIDTKQLSIDTIELTGNVEGFNKEQRYALVKSLIEGVYTDKKTIKTDVPHDGTFDINNNPYIVAGVLNKLKVKVRQSAILTKEIQSSIKKLDRRILIKSDDGDIMTDGKVAFSIPRDASNYLLENTKEFGEIDEDDGSIANKVAEILEYDYLPVENQPTECLTTTNNKLYSFSKDRTAMFAKKYVDIIKDGELSLSEKKFGGNSVLKAETEDGTLIGFVLPSKLLQGESDIKEEKPVTLKSLTVKAKKDAQAPKKNNHEPKEKTNNALKEGNNEQGSDKGLSEVSESRGLQETSEGEKTERKDQGTVPVRRNQGDRDKGSPSGTTGEVGPVAERPGRGQDESSSVGSTQRNGDAEGGNGVQDKGFRITELPILSASKGDRYDANITAIELLNKLEAEGREPSSEEKQVLANFTSWGGLKNIFNSKTTADKNRSEKLKSLISKEDYMNAEVNSTLTAFYTPVEVVKNIYSILKNMGFTKGNILEPSCGTGIFIGAMPESMRNSSINMVEIDSISGKIAKYLYPNATVNIKGFQDVDIAKDSVDLVVGNIPYAKNLKVFDKNFNYGRRDIHDFFMIKGLDVLKEGGIMAVLAPTSVMDGGNESFVGENISQRAKLVAAFRLPSGTFGNTEVVCDLIILQKKGVGLSENTVDYPSNGKITVDGTQKTISRYFIDNPQNVLGEFAIKEMGKTRKDLVVKDTGKTLLDVVDTVPKNIIAKAKAAKATEQVKTETAKAPVRVRENGMLFEENGEMFAVENWEIVNPYYYQKTAKEVFLDKNGNETFEETDTPLLDKDGKQVKRKKRVEIEKGSKDYKRIKALNRIAELYRELVVLQEQTEGEEPLIEARKKLNDAYDKFSKDFKSKKGPGRINDQKNSQVFNDPRIGMLKALEKKTPFGYVKAEVFTKRTVNTIKVVTSVDSAADALIASINNSGTVDLNYMSELYGKDKDTIAKELYGDIYETPEEEGNYVVADEYLSGNVKAKLKYAEEHNKNGRYDANIEALKKVIPEDIKPADISIKLGSTWVSSDVIEDFVKDITNVPDLGVKVTYVPYNSMWVVDTKGREVDFGKWKTEHITGEKLLTAALNNQSITITEKDDYGNRYTDVNATEEVQQKIEDLQEYFARWALGKDASRTAKITKLYNDEMNNTVRRKYRGSFLTMPGSVINLYQTQKNAIYRIMSSPATLLNHAVGAGKTFTMLGAIHEMKRLGVVNKPVLVVPNNKIDDFISDFYRMYPTSKVLGVKTDEWNKANRERMLHQIQSTDYDVIIIRHSSFESFGFTKEYEENYLNERKAEAEQALETAKASGASERSLSSLKKRIESYAEKIKELLDRETDNIIGFDNAGIDALFVDEAHNFKNLENFTKMDRIPGAGTGDAKKTTRMHMATEYIHQRGGKVVFATATPISNTMGEIYNMFRYLRPDILTNFHMPSFDAFASTFGDIITRNEPNTTGTGLVAKKRFAKFINIPELMTAFNTFNDTVTIDDIKKNNPDFKLPKANRINVSVESNELLDMWNQYIESEKQRIKKMKPEELKKEGINNLLLYSDAKMAALDLRMIAKILQEKGYLPYGISLSELDFKGSKINKLADKVFDYYSQSSDRLGTQLIFLDKGTPQTKISQEDINRMNEIKRKERMGEEISEKDAEWYAEQLSKKRYNFDLYADIKKKLIQRGVPENEIAFIQDASTDKKREKLFDDVRAGRVRVLLGSTRTLGEGVNVQDKIVAIHHVDAPDRPSDIAQRDGRGERQGNENETIDILYYSTKNSFDAFAWDALDKKASFIRSVTSEEVERSHEDVDEVDFGSLSLEAANNPLFKEKADLQDRIKKAETKKRNIINDTYEKERIIDQNKGKIAEKNQEIVMLEAAKAQADSHKEIKATIDREEIEGFKAISKKAESVLTNLSIVGGWVSIGDYRGLNLVGYRRLVGDFSSGAPRFRLGVSDKKLSTIYAWVYADDITWEESNSTNYPFASVAKRLDNQINKLQEQIDGRIKSRDYLQQAYDNALKTKIEPFTEEQEEQLRKDKVRLKEITEELGKIGSANTTNPFKYGTNLESVISDIHRGQVEQAMVRAHSEVKKAKNNTSDKETVNKVKEAMERGKAQSKAQKEQYASGELYTPKAEAPKSDATGLESYDNVAREMFKHFGVALARGGNFRKRIADGFYQVGRKTVKTRDYNNLGVDAHELGHHFDRLYSFTKKFKTELGKMANKFDSSVKRKYGEDKAVLRGEALAEFVRLYLLNPDGAREFADGTDFYALFEKTLSSEDRKALNLYGERIRTILGAESVERAKSTIRHYGEKKKDIRTIQDKIDDNYTTLVDENFPIKKMVDFIEKESGKKIEPHRDSYLLAKQLDKGGAIASDMVANGVHKPNDYSRLTKSFTEILAPVKKNIAEFEVYLKAKDALDVFKNGKKVFPGDFSEQEIEDMVSSLEAKYSNFEATADAVYDFWETFERAWLVDTGHISETTFRILRALYPHYVPKFRFTEKSTKDGGRRGGSALKRMSYSGSDLETYSPIESLMYEMDRIVKAEMRRQINLQIRELYYDSDPDVREAVSMFVTREDSNLTHNVFNAKQLKEDLTDRTMHDIIASLTPEQKAKLRNGTNNEIRQVLDELGIDDIVVDAIDNYIDDFIEYFTPVKSTNGVNQILIPMAKVDEETGEDYDSYEVFRVLDPSLYNALANRNTHELKGLIKILAGWRRAFTALTTSKNILFGLLSNVRKDFQHALIMSNTTIPFQYTKDWVKAIVDILKKSDMYNAYKAMGGSGASILSEGKDYFATQRAKNKVKKAIREIRDKVEDFNNAIESAPRLSEFKRVLKENTDNGMSKEDALILAARAGAELTTDFSQRGASEVLDQMAAVIPFFRAGINGLDNLYRGFSGNFARDSKKTDAERKKATMNSLAKAVIYLTIPTILLAIAHRDDEEYDKLPDYYKLNYWIFNKEWFTRNPEDKGKFIRIPKPRELGWLFSSTMEAAFFEQVDSEDDNGKALLDSFVDTFVPSYDTVFAPFVDAARNTTWSGNTIVSQAYDDLLKGGYFDEVYDDSTSRIAVILAKMLPNVKSWGVINTPKGIDYLLKQMTGGIGQILLPLTTPADEGVLASINKKRTVDTTYSNRYVDLYYNIKDLQSGAKETNDTDVYDEAMYNLFNTTSKSVVADAIQKGVKIPQDSILRELSTYKNVSAKGKVTYGIAPSKRISALWSEIRDYNNDRSLTKAERKEKIMECRKEINEISQAMVDVYRNYMGGDVGEEQTPASRYYSEAVNIDYADEDNSLLPATLDTSFEGTNLTLVQLTASQYTEYQQDYEDNYWSYIDENFGSATSNTDKAAIMKASKTVAKERAKSNIVSGGSDYFDKYSGTKVSVSDADIVRYKALVDVANDEKNLTQEDYISIIKSLGLTDYENYLLFHSQYKSDKNNPWAAYKN